MADSHLATYLHDHLAGAVMALELMEHLERDFRDAPAIADVAKVRSEVEADRRELEEIVDRLALREGAPRKAAAWLSERVARLKLRLDDLSDGSLYLFEAIELLSLGIEGKNALWRALAAVAPDLPSLQTIDFDRLVMRANAQRATLEPARLDMARRAFGA